MPRYGFGDFVLDSDTVEVSGPDGIREVEPQVFGVLQYLVEQGDRLVTKDELLENVWGNKFVSESALTTRIKQARRAVDDDGVRQWAIKTVHGRGYRFVAPIEVAEPVPAAPSAEPSRVPPAAQPVAARAREDHAHPPTALPDELRMDGRRPFCGRREELVRGAAIVDDPDPDAPIGWVWILGEPGMGKSRLAAQLAAGAHARGHRVVFGRNSEDLRVPYQPFVEVLTQLVGDAAGADAAHLPSLPDQVAHLLPSLGGPGPRGTGGATAHVDDEGRRFQLFEALAGWLARCAEVRPLVIVVDDVHWASESTLQLLAHLQHRHGHARVTMILTARDTAPDASERVADLMATAQGRPRTALLHLAGLDEADAAQLVGDDSLDMAEVMRQTAGNPLFLHAVDPVSGSAQIEVAVRRRLNTLPTEVQDTLRMMSVLGLEFELSVAAAAHGRDELDLLDELEAATAARLLEDIGVERFRFTHALVRSSLRDQLSSARRARMHRRIAEALARVFGADPLRLPELAYHTAEAARSDPALRPVAVERLMRAAEAACERLSFPEAADLLRQARVLAVDADPRTQADLALAAGNAEHRAGRNMPAARIFGEAILLARDTDDVTTQVEAALRYEDARWRPGLAGERSLEFLEEAADLLDEAVAAGEEVPTEPDLRARLAVGRLRALAMSGRPDEAEAAFAGALRLATEMGSPTLEANVLGVYLGHVVLHRGVEEARPMIERLAELERDILDGDIALHALHDRIMFGTLSGDFGAVRRLVATMATLQRRYRSTFWELVRANQEAMEAFYRGDLVESERLTEHCLTLADRLPDEDGSGTYGLRMFLIRREQDRLAILMPMIRTVLARTRGDSLWTPGLAWLLAETGAPEDAATVLADLRESGFELPRDAMWSTVMVFLVEAVVRTGDRDACRVLRERLDPLAGSNITTGSGQVCFGRADRYLGMLSLTLGELTVAEQQLGAALEGDADGGSVLFANDSRLWLSRVRRAQGHGAEADAMLRVVATEAESAGLVRLARVAREGLAG
ncbi:AAA family ATPase [Nocardioides sp. YIM 152588]|uniref:AAA family ATPase n=1 Tax=Nocardioides sp. YIM 152588 TaxID=3158259 RepID=UPI0032E4B11F